MRPILNDLNVSPVFYKNYEAIRSGKYKIIVNQGGTRSGKTYSIIQNLILLQYEREYEISVVSKTLPHIKKGAMRDFKKIVINDWDVYEDNKFNKSELVYKFGTNGFIEFFSADDSAKLRGPGREILFINEANLLSYKEFLELIFRTRGIIIIDYNPVDENSWIYDKVIPRKDCLFLQSSYLDNYDFLPQSQIDEIERLKDEDYTLWQIYGLGNVAKATNLIYPSYELATFESGGETIYGLDFGYNNPTALLKASLHGTRNLYLKQILYDTKLTNADLIIELEKLIDNHTDFLYADNAEPARIEEIQRAGFNIFPANKSVKTGIDYCKRFNFFIDPDSIDLLKEIKSYKWKEDRNGNILDEPVKYRDHLMDVIRYSAFTHGLKYWDVGTFSFPNINLDRTNPKASQGSYSGFDNDFLSIEDKYSHY